MPIRVHETNQGRTGVSYHMRENSLYSCVINTSRYLSIADRHFPKPRLPLGPATHPSFKLKPKINLPTSPPPRSPWHSDPSSRDITARMFTRLKLKRIGIGASLNSYSGVPSGIPLYPGRIKRSGYGRTMISMIKQSRYDRIIIPRRRRKNAKRRRRCRRKAGFCRQSLERVMSVLIV